ncbi:conserved hypothetical protein [Pediculus humanus corporis]|uniref:COX assembly mitochondrial protein n=1 Tax=Pediculus humanus subsp. corporis TaxID=121224 RepID=E0VE94_PEDHC|nr:uncharacterized protein Phum_PHUM129230 [Pediculus humanus corporis]EEB11700.1 conserved hypothetical protein [Pediculus humanus corporis]
MTVDTQNDDHKQNKLLFGGGPLGFGDPDDDRLRIVEKNVLIPKKLREEAIRKCKDVVEPFVECCQNSGLLNIFKCRKENQLQLECIKSWMDNEEFKDEITKQYLEERKFYRTTGKKYESQ